MVHQDSYYYKEFVQFPYARNMGDEMESPDSIDWESMLDVIMKYDGNVIVEGHCLMACKELVKMADLIFFISKERDDCFRRFMTRYSEGLTYEQNSIKADYYNRVTWPCHEKYMKTHVYPHTLDDNFFKLPGYKYSAGVIIDIIKSKQI